MLKRRKVAESPITLVKNHKRARIKPIHTYKKQVFWVGILIIAVVGLLILLPTINPLSNKNEPTSITNENEYSGFDMDALIDNRTPYIGTNSKVVALIDAMPLSTGVARTSVELQTANQPYGITIHFELNEKSRVINARGAISENAFYPNAVMLFSLIDNVDFIYCIFTDDANNEALYTLNFSRGMVEERLGVDVRDYASNSSSLQGLIDQLRGYLVVNEPIEDKLDIIMSSPSLSSNPYDYIQAHLEEYEAIVNQGDEALQYLLAQFEKTKPNNNNTLRGFIMRYLIKDLLGDKDTVTDESLSPQEWYDQLKNEG
jgi:bla regulator protein BlaR1